MAIVPTLPLWKRLQRRFLSSARRVAVRTHVPLPVKIILALLAIALVSMLTWGGFDAGRLIAGFNSSKVEEERTRILGENNALKTENAELRRLNIQLDSDARVAVGAREALANQLSTLNAELAQAKDEVNFFQKLVTGATKETGVVIQRLQLNKEGDAAYHFRALVSQASAAPAEFKGTLQLTANVQHEGKRSNIVLPDDQKDLAASLKLAFKTHQRVSGVFQVPEGALVKSVQARVLEAGSNAQRAQITQQIP